MAELVMRMDEYSFLKEFETSDCYKDRFSRENIFAIYDFIESEYSENEYIVFCLVDIAERFRQDTIEDFLRYKINESPEEIEDLFEESILENILKKDFEKIVEKITTFSEVVNIDKEGNILSFKEY